MRFLTDHESKEWCTERIRLTPDGFPVPPSRERDSVRGPVSTDISFCRQLERALQPREACLLWVTTWGVWKSSENLHLYYRLRQSYGDLRLLREAPGHLFLEYEDSDLVSFLQVGLLCGWDMHLLPVGGYARAFVSHDEYVEFGADESNQAIMQNYAAELGGAEIIHAAPTA